MMIGFELEMFCLDKLGKPILVPSPLPLDECGWLVEVRSEPHHNVTKAIHLFLAEMSIVEAQALKAGVNLLMTSLYDIPRDLKVEARRKGVKGLLHYDNIYGFQNHKTNLATASLHVSFTNEKTFAYRDEKNDPRTHKYPGFVDHAKIIVALDKAFKQEIKDSKRNPGFYERKSDGRIEYRSLPNTVSLAKLETTLQEILK